MPELNQSTEYLNKQKSVCEELNKKLDKLNIAALEYRIAISKPNAVSNARKQDSIKSLAFNILNIVQDLVPKKGRIRDLSITLGNFAGNLNSEITIDQERKLLTSIMGIVSTMKKETDRFVKKQIEPLMKLTRR